MSSAQQRRTRAFLNNLLCAEVCRRCSVRQPWLIITPWPWWVRLALTGRTQAKEQA